MSDAASHNLKVSREGIVLIKSFEGFRPRAIQRVEGGWIIGYGHTLSAREGATVSEADAELLLRYDLMPVEKTVNETVPADLNQHQFDALVSFAFSVGVDRFASSDVRQRLNAGAPGEAADAIMGWPEPALPETALRRRAAERALFVANPGAPVALSDLLSAPLPPPPVPTPVEEPEIEPVAEVEPAVVAPETEADTVAPVDPRGAAVAALLGEPPVRLVQDEAPHETIIPTFAVPVTVVDAAPAPSNDNPPVEAEVEAPTAEPVSEVAVEDPTPEPIEPPADLAEQTDEPHPALDADADADADEPALEGPAAIETPTEDAPAPGNAIAWSPARYSPYSLSMVGPLPYLQPAAPSAQPDTLSIDHAVVEVAPVEVEDAPIETTASEPESQITTDVVEPAIEPTVETDAATVDDVTTGSDIETPFEADAGTLEAALETQPTPETSLITPDETSALEPVADAEPTAPVEPMAYVAPVPVAPVAELVLTPLEDAPEPAFARPLWTAEERDAPDGSENNLFGEDLALTLGGSVMRHEMEFEAPAKFDWKETAPFIFMGGVGLVSFGASMAAFRRAAEQSGGSELTIIGWVLALIGLGCVGVSSINLYRKFGLPGGD